MKGCSIFVGTSQCNAACKNCAGKQYRKIAPQQDGEFTSGPATVGAGPDVIKAFLANEKSAGTTYVSISSSGEPLLSPKAVTKALELIKETGFNRVNLYTNGLQLIDKYFCETYLSSWKASVLTNVYVSTHSGIDAINARGFGIDYVPSLRVIFAQLQSYFQVRANLILRKGCVDTLEHLKFNYELLLNKGADQVVAWPIRANLKAEGSALSHPKDAPAIIELDKMRNWIDKESIKLRLDWPEKHNTNNTLFQNGVISKSWC